MEKHDFDALNAAGRLPSPKGVALQLMRLMQSEMASLGQIATLIKSDPALAGRVVATANAGVDHARRRIVSVPEALAVNGTAVTCRLVMGLSIVSATRSGYCEGFDYPLFWKQSLLAGLAMQAIARQVRVAAPEEVFTVGLLAQVGKLALATLHPHDYGSLLSASPDGRALRAREQQEYATDHLEIGRYLLTDWGMPEVFIAAIGFAHRGENVDESRLAQRTIHIGHALRIASSIARTASRDARIALASTAPAPSLELLALTPGSLEPMWNEVVAMWPAWESVLGLARSALPAFAPAGAHGEQMLAATPDDAPRDPATAHAAHPAHPARVVAVPVALPVPGTFACAHDECVDHCHAPELTDLESTATMDAVRLGDDARRDRNEPGATLLRALVHSTDLVLCERICALLMPFEAEVLVCESDDDTLASTLEYNPQIVVHDWHAGAANALKLCRTLRDSSFGRSTYIIVIGDDPSEQALVEALDAGADDYFQRTGSQTVLGAHLRVARRFASLQEELCVDRDRIHRVATDLSVSNRRLNVLAQSDALTGLPNRRYAFDHLEREWRDARGSHAPLSCLMIDIDNFKLINDAHGHDTGDLVLAWVARLLRSSARAQDTVCRIGGEEFLVICKDTALADAMRCAERLRAAVAASPLETGGLAHPVTISIGAAQRRTGADETSLLLKRADEALYISKRDGRNRVTADAA